MSHVFTTMGTVASLDVRQSPFERSDADALTAVFDSLERTFSLYRDGSELSRIAAGTLRLAEASSEVLELYSEALQWRRDTDGAFTAHRPDGVVDLDGLVKAVAIARAGALLASGGTTDWMLNVGGDILVSGEPRTDSPGTPGTSAGPTRAESSGTGCGDAGPPWVVGIVDPADRSTFLCTIELHGSRRAVATSGTSERGEHIWRRSAVLSDLAQVTVVADDIVTADVLATAILSGGSDYLRVATGRWPIDVCAVGLDGGIAMTPGLRAALSSGGTRA